MQTKVELKHFCVAVGNIFLLLASFSRSRGRMGGCGCTPGAYPSSPWAKAGFHPGQVVRLLQGPIERKTTICTPTHSYGQIGIPSSPRAQV